MTTTLLRATYRVAATADEIGARAEAIALEQSAEMPREAIASLGVPDLPEEAVARVVRVAPEGPGSYAVEIEIPAVTQDGSAGQLVNALFGNSSMHSSVSLEDVAIPEPLAAGLGGPHHGIAGVRLAVDVPRAPLTCTALKPQGLASRDLARLCECFARAGIDVIKDDHGLADQRRAPFAERVALCAEATLRAADATGRRALYAPNLLAGPARLREDLDVVRGAGLRAVMAAPALIGLPTFHELVRENDDLIFLAHPSFSGSCRIAPRVLLGTLFPLLGADAVVYPHAGGRFSEFDESVVKELARRLRASPAGRRGALPVPGGGVDAARARELVEFYGNDVMLLVGGSLYLAGDRLREHASTFVETVRAAATSSDGTEEG